MKGILFRPDVWQGKLRVIEQGGIPETRRVMKPQPFMSDGVMRWIPRKGIDINLTDHPDLAIPFARFQVGDVVHIKEAWCLGAYKRKVYADIIYKSGSKTETEVITIPWNGWLDTHTLYGASNKVEDKWRSPLFMSEWAARYYLKILAVEPQRLQEITEEQAEKEGFDPTKYDNPDAYADFPCTNQFIQIWDFINKPPYDWASNPWVWPYQFKLVEKPSTVKPSLMENR